MTSKDNAAGPGVILLVDDDVQMGTTIARFLRRFEHRVETVQSVREALERLERGPVDVVVTDLRMPGSSGLELLKEVRARFQGTRSILMSGRAGAADAAVAIETGIDRLLLKPFDLEELRLAVEKALAEGRAQAQRVRDQETLKALVSERETESRLWVLRAAHALAAAVEAKDAYTAGHAARVTAYSMKIANVIGGVDPIRFRLAGDLHDVGKIGVPDAVLNKPGRLTAEEFAHIRKHPEAGVHILEMLLDDPLVLGVTRSHHERWDGRGYPDAIAGDSIPLPARVLAVSDTLDAMTSSRAYRTALRWDVAVAEIHACSGSQFDPEVVEAFTVALPELEALHRGFNDREESTVIQIRP